MKPEARRSRPAVPIAARRRLLAAALAAPFAHRATAQPALRPDVGYVPTPASVVHAMLDLARVGPQDVVYDLGSGDGRIAIAAGRRGARALGIDIDPVRVDQARQNAARAKLEDRVRFVQGDLFELDLAPATVITLYLLPRLNLRLRPTLQALRPGTRIVSHGFDMGDWTPQRTLNVELRPVYLWTVS